MLLLLHFRIRIFQEGCTSRRALSHFLPLIAMDRSIFWMEASRCVLLKRLDTSYSMLQNEDMMSQNSPSNLISLWREINTCFFPYFHYCSNSFFLCFQESLSSGDPMSGSRASSMLSLVIESLLFPISKILLEILSSTK